MLPISPYTVRIAPGHEVVIILSGGNGGTTTVTGNSTRQKIKKLLGSEENRKRSSSLCVEYHIIPHGNSRRGVEKSSVSTLITQKISLQKKHHGARKELKTKKHKKNTMRHIKLSS